MENSKRNESSIFDLGFEHMLWMRIVELQNGINVLFAVSREYESGKYNLTVRMRFMDKKESERFPIKALSDDNAVVSGDKLTLSVLTSLITKNKQSIVKNSELRFDYEKGEIEKFIQQSGESGLFDMWTE